MFGAFSQNLNKLPNLFVLLFPKYKGQAVLDIYRDEVNVLKAY